ncbi:archaeal ATPase (macronuclear) [Tetrahymena thermophila SB210]|uniref:Archaeal ATPase n=1 Tax=Tetrahymena thermophila (strain SB210) TaxID=312017 RepID=I7M2S7_TETTS|nr:archaeal ATPase [Tetrahymena thermophila SB210]EAS01218.2 archaeal ATPase [Tetrahymena thermophila SB210]|eukprot:XP_001021463.2 archaeal ATPase [Tetrahymena thermophila SB210]
MECFQLSVISYIFNGQEKKILDVLIKKGIATLKDYQEAKKQQILQNIISVEELNFIDKILQDLLEQFQQQENKLQMHLQDQDSDNSSDDDDDDEDQNKISVEKSKQDGVNINLNTQEELQPQLFINYFQTLSSDKEERQMQNEINTFIQYGQVTEIYGLPGCGKTTLCLNYVKNHQYQSQMANSKNQVLYVDFENGMMIERLICILSLKSQVRVKDSLSQIILKNISKEDEARVYMERLTDMLSVCPDINFVILDGFIPKILSYISNPDFNRKGNVTNLLADLKNFIKKKKIALILTNTVSFERQKHNSQKNQVQNPPSEFSTVFNNFVDNRLYLFKLPNSIYNYIAPLKLNEYSEKIIDTKIPFKIEEHGVEIVLQN